MILEQVGKTYPDGSEAVSGLDLTIADGEFLVFVGPSGCGKTTALRMIAGLEGITTGTISIGGRVVNQVPARDRDVAMVFQNYALYPHLSVAENIGFGLKLRKVPKAEITRRVNDAASILGLEGFLARKPRALSGGQRQRVAMGRAIVREPQAFLMDEPLSNLDAKLRVQMRAEIAGLQKRLGTTTVYVTHDQVEAMTMGDRVAVIRKGVLQQVAPPQELYDHPVNLFVGGFIGSPAMNLVKATLRRQGEHLYIHFGSHRIRLSAELLARRAALAGLEGAQVVVGIRPEDFEHSSLVPGAAEDQQMSVTAGLVEALGSELMVHFSVDAPAVLTEDTRELARDAGTEPVGGATSTFVARLSPRSPVSEDDRLTLAVDTERLHFFDAETGLALAATGSA